MEGAPDIRRRSTPSSRRKDGLIKYARDTTDQNGENGIIQRIFHLLPPPSARGRVCVDIGARDGKHLSNTHSLLVPSSRYVPYNVLICIGAHSKLMVLFPLAARLMFRRDLGRACLWRLMQNVLRSYRHCIVGWVICGKLILLVTSISILTALLAPCSLKSGGVMR